MRFVRLRVKDFMGVESAELEFAPGVNVLHGPNDLGKSTLAAAIRAALLIPATSAQADDFFPWHKDGRPEVELTFVGPDERHWLVTKRFGKTNGSAELRVSNDGRAFVGEAKARDVDGKLRELLAWGISPPGGSGGKKLPESFLTQTLLAAQTDVGDILQSSLENDAEEAGKVRLTKALGALAQDETLKRVLDAANNEVSNYFTATGQRSKKAGSPFKLESDKVTVLAKEMDDLRTKLEEARSARATIASLQERRNELLEARELAAAALEEVQRLLALGADRLKAENLVEEARRVVRDIDELAAKCQADHGQLETLDRECTKAQQNLDAATLASKSASEAIAAATEAVRRAKSDDAAKDRQVREAGLRVQLAEIASKRQEQEARRERGSLAVQAAKTLADARQAAAKAAARVQAAKAAVLAAQKTYEEFAANERLVRGIRSYGEWRNGLGMLEKARSRGTEAAALLERAEDLEERLKTNEAAISGKSLPLKEAIHGWRNLERELGEARAALGVGFSITLTPRRPVNLRARLDDGEARARQDQSEVWVLEADRIAELGIDDALEISIAAGEAGARARAENLQTRWNAEVAPELSRLGARDVDGLSGQREELDRQISETDRFRRDAADLRERAGELRGQVGEEETLRRRVEELAGDFADLDRDKLQTFFERMGASWESQVRVQEEEAGAALSDSQRAVNEAERENGQAQGALGAAETGVAAAQDAWSKLGVPDPDAIVRDAEAALSQIDSTERAVSEELAALANESSGEVHAAEARLAEAEVQAARVDASLKEGRVALDAARSNRDRRQGELKVREEELAKRDRAAAERRVVEAEAVLAQHPRIERRVSEDDFRVAQTAAEQTARDLETLTRELDQAQGALQQTGGMVVEEEFQNVGDALQRARERQADTERDAEAWKLLVETLREVENAEGTHLGRALAEPVAKRFAELTNGRYESVVLGPGLGAQQVHVVGTNTPEEALNRLSVGTREQLATLIRIAIAEALGSSIVLDDHLVQSDPTRLEWFRELLGKAGKRTQVVVFTCRPEDYRGDAVHRVDLNGKIVRWKPESNLGRVTSSTV